MTDELNEADLKAADAGVLVKLAAAVQGITGVLVALCGVQLLGMRFYEEWYELFKYGLIAGGALQLVLAPLVFRARPWAAFSAAAMGLVMAIAIGAWAVISIPAGLFSCMVMVSPPVAFVTAILAFLAIGPVLKTAAARERLSQQGMGLGL